jgi:hypothetical protein
MKSRNRDFSARSYEAAIGTSAIDIDVDPGATAPLKLF